MRTVVLCGSRRYHDQIRAFGARLKELGVDVYEPYLNRSEWDNLTEEFQRYVALGLTLDHFRKIELADVIYVYNEDGYAGYSTTMEMGYAAALRKPIYAYASDPEGPRGVLVREIITTPEELAKKL